MLERMKNDIQFPAYSSPPVTASSSKKHSHDGNAQHISDPSYKKPRRGCRAGKKHRKNAMRKGYITAAQGSRGSHGRGRIPMKKTAAQGSRGPQGRGRMMSTSAVGRSNCGARVISKDSEDHGIGRRLDRGTHKFMKVRVSANKGSMTYGEEISA